MASRLRQENRDHYTRLRTAAARLRVVATAAVCLTLLLLCCNSIPPFIPLIKEKERLTRELELYTKKEQDSLAKLECYRIEISAMKNDPAYIEIMARDVLRRALPGERILSIQRK